MVSIICPVYNEEEILLKNILSWQQLSSCSELIFVDGQSTDRSREIINKCGRLVVSSKGRAVQMNCGAAAAKGDILLFLHADSLICADTLRSIEKRIIDYGFMGGCLSQQIDDKAFIYRLIEAQGNRRARLTKIFYGDQAIFVRSDIFHRIGGFPEAPIFEDVLFSRKLKSCGKTVVLSDKVRVSARRWQKRGIIRTMFLYNFILMLFNLGLPLNKISGFYKDLR